MRRRRLKVLLDFDYSKNFLDSIHLAETENKSKSDQVILKEVLDEMLEKNRNIKLKEIKKSWTPTHRPYFDKVWYSLLRSERVIDVLLLRNVRRSSRNLLRLLPSRV